MQHARDFINYLGRLFGDWILQAAVVFTVLALVLDSVGFGVYGRQLPVRPWMYAGIWIMGLLLAAYRLDRRPHWQPSNESEAVVLQAPIPIGPPVVMKDRDFDRDVARVLRKSQWEIIKPRPDSVFKYERRAFERIFTDHQGESRQIVIGGTADNPDNIPLKRRDISRGCKKLLHAAYKRSVRPDIGCCFSYDAGSDSATIGLNDGSELDSYQAAEAVKELYRNSLVAPHPTERNLYCLTDIGKGRALDIDERRLLG